MVRFMAMLILGSTGVPAAMAEPPSDPTAFKTSAYLGAGIGSGQSHMGRTAFGGLLVRDLTSRISLEVAGSYLGHTMGSDDFSASGSVLWHLASNRDKAVPYLVAGGGLYRRSSGMGGRPHGPDDMGRGGMGSARWMGRGAMMSTRGGDRGRGIDRGHMGHGDGVFRMRPGTAHQRDRSFTDPAVTVGGGLRIDVGSRLFVRPDARALIVTSNGETNTVGLFTLSLGYRF